MVRNRGCLHSLQISPYTILIRNKGKNSNFTVNRESWYHCNQEIKVNIICLLIWCTARDTEPITWYSDEKCIVWIRSLVNKSELRAILQNNLSIFFIKSVKIQMDILRRRNSSRLKETKGTWQPNATCDPGPDRENETTGEM